MMANAVDTITNHRNSGTSNVNQDSRLGIDIEFPHDHDYLATSPSRHSNTCLQRQTHHPARDMPTSRRAKHHLRHHGRDSFGRDYFFFPTMLKFHDACEVIGEAYAGKDCKKKNRISQWMTEPLHIVNDELPHLTRILVGTSIHDTLNNGGVLFGIHENGKLKSCLLFREVDPSKEAKKGLLKRFADLCAIVQLKSTETTEFVDHAQLRHNVGTHVVRAQELEDSFTEWHQAYYCEKSHWYLTDIAVAPEYQGQGYGKEMMSTLTKLADRYRIDLYLECGTDISAFFGKFGFEELDVKQIPSTIEDVARSLAVSLMVRKSV